MEAGIVAQGVAKSFGSIQALASIDLTVEPGEVVALLGGNGAGKSTLVRILATTLIHDAGRVKVGGWDTTKSPARARAATGVLLGEDRSFYWRLTGRQNLEFFAGLHGMRIGEARARSQDTLEGVGLADRADQRVDQYSTGMRARLGLARALLGHPSVLLLDEPTRSLDPLAAITVRKLILDLAAERSLAVLFVTHDLHEAAAVSTEVAIVAQGRIAKLVQDRTDAVGLERTLVTVNGTQH
jgi:ABC-2 type transport system ATP-binding protein